MADHEPRGRFGSLLPIGALLVIGYVVVALNLGVPFAIPGFIFLVGGGVGFLYSPLGKALTRSLEADAGLPHPELPNEVLGELDDLRARMAELEERQDFSERLLGRSQELPPLKNGEGR
ncbi:MAG: hypothetical protein ACREOE_07080 [Gemmatimonadales bacterium]